MRVNAIRKKLRFALLVAEAVILILFARILLAFLPFSRLTPLFSHPQGKTELRGGQRRAVRVWVKKAIFAAWKRLPLENTCFHRANPQDSPSVFKHEALRRLENLRRDGVDISLESDFSRPFLRLPDATRYTVQTWLKGRRHYPEKHLVAICPGARSQSNTWPLKRSMEIGRRLINLDAYEVVVCGGPAERTTGELLVQEWGEGINAAGCFSVLESAALLGECHFMVGLDTGTTHLAAAVGTPCITLQGGRILPGHWDPLGNNHTVLRFPVPCSGCRLTTCKLSMHPCMKGISVEVVWQAILNRHNNSRVLP